LKQEFTILKRIQHLKEVEKQEEKEEEKEGEKK
jgi:hypothetical protein